MSSANSIVRALQGSFFWLPVSQWLHCRSGEHSIFPSDWDGG